MKLFFLTLFTIHTGNLLAQITDYISYKQDCNQIYVSVIDSGKFHTGIAALNGLKKKYKTLCGEEYILQAFCYHQLGKTKKASIALRDAWSERIYDQGYLTQIDGFNWKEISDGFNEKQTERVQEGFRNNVAQMSKDYDSLLYLIERINNSDQKFRSYLDKGDTVNFRKRMIEQDSLDMLEFERIYKKYGFPGEKVANLFSMMYFAFFLHSADYDWFYAKMKEPFLNEVKAGNMSASMYLNWLDRHNVSSGKPVKYAMYGNPNHFKATPEEIEQIKQARLALGVVNAFRIPYDLRSN